MSLKKDRHRWCILFAAMLFATLAVEGQDATTEADMDVRLDVYRAADLVVTPIDFGTVLINSESGTVTMDSAGALSFTGGILGTFDGPFGSAKAGTLTMDANAGATATITLDPAIDLGAGVTLTPALDNAAVAMTGGPVTISVYGRVDFPADTKTGDYDGVLVVNVTYN